MSDKDGCKGFIERIKRNMVIPVIGHGLYRANVESEGLKDVLLYDYLASQVLAECGGTVNSDENQRFAKACFEFLKKNGNDYWKLTEYLKEKIAGVRLVPEDSLWKLARIRCFNIFIDTAYDDLFYQTIKTVRTTHIEALSYTRQEKNFNYLDTQLFRSLKDSSSSLIYQIFGNLQSIEPAFTEGDMLETVTEFQKDMAADRHNHLFQKLKSSSLLFIGCGYDDWLFRFFIRTLANNPYELSVKEGIIHCLVSENFKKNKKDPSLELQRFLESYHVVAYQNDDARDFVQILFEDVNKQSPECIISEEYFPGQVFISFENTDRPAAQHLADNLRGYGIAVWLDEIKINVGEEFDETIIKAIDKCPIFIPLISKNSQKDFSRNKYYIKEWLLAQANRVIKNTEILPIIIDDSKKMEFKEFEKLQYYRIPGGKQEGQFEELVKQINKLLPK